MINTRKFFLVLWLYVVCFGITGNAGECLATSEIDYTIPRHLEWSFTLQNTTNQVREQAELWTYAPRTLTATQQRIHVDASHPFEELSDEAGNSILHFSVYNLPPYATKIITIQTDLLLSDTPLPIEARSAKFILPRSTKESLPYLWHCEAKHTNTFILILFLFRLLLHSQRCLSSLPVQIFLTCLDTNPEQFRLKLSPLPAASPQHWSATPWLRHSAPTR